jgi:hypothetical protein
MMYMLIILSMAMNVGAGIFLHPWQTRISPTQDAIQLVPAMHLTAVDKLDGYQCTTTQPNILQEPTQLYTDHKPHRLSAITSYRAATVKPPQAVL